MSIAICIILGYGCHKSPRGGWKPKESDELESRQWQFMHYQLLSIYCNGWLVVSQGKDQLEEDGWPCHGYNDYWRNQWQVKIPIPGAKKMAKAEIDFHLLKMVLYHLLKVLAARFNP